MTSSSRRAREKAAVHERILDAARAMFARDGIEAVSMRKIAAAIDYTPAALYVHFKDKEALIRALCRHDFRALQLEQQKVAAAVADPVERIRRIGLAICRFAGAHPNHYRFMFMTPKSDVEPAPEDLARAGDPDEDGYAFFVELCRQAIGAGRIRPDLRDAHLVAQTFWAAIHGAIALHITFADDPWVHLRPLATRARVIVDCTVEGLTRGAASPAPAGRTPGRARA
ncbi:MAG: TetR/AcrR family transcriptional regulator [Phycisphaerae bacterium]|nr:TetR/AcrR family transcriptional regulator [Phycisphaerae bacterium]